MTERRYDFAEPSGGSDCWWPTPGPRSSEILNQPGTWYGASVLRPLDDRLTVSADVMACLEADYPEVAGLFQIAPTPPKRWVTGIEAENVPDGWELRP